MRLLDRLRAAGRNLPRIGPPRSGDLTPGITRRPTSLPDDERQRVGGRVHAVVMLRCYKEINVVVPAQFRY